MQETISRHAFKVYGAVGGRKAWRDVSAEERSRIMTKRVKSRWKKARAKKVSVADAVRKASPAKKRAILNGIKHQVAMKKLLA